MKAERVMILGATGGIGRELVKTYAKTGCRLILVGRDREKLIHLRRQFADRAKIKLICLDLNEKTDYSSLFQSFGPDLVINAVGSGKLGKVISEPLWQIQSTNWVNYEAVICLMQDWAKSLPEQKSVFVNLSSMASLFPHPYLATYSASKAALHSFSFAFNQELKAEGLKLRVFTYVLGPTDTDFFPAEQKRKIGGLELQMKPEAVAARISRLIKKEKPTAIVGRRNRLIYLLLSHIPLGIRTWLLSTVLKRGLL